VYRERRINAAKRTSSNDSAARLHMMRLGPVRAVCRRAQVDGLGLGGVIVVTNMLGTLLMLQQRPAICVHNAFDLHCRYPGHVVSQRFEDVAYDVRRDRQYDFVEECFILGEGRVSLGGFLVAQSHLTGKRLHGSYTR
jgi:hypothetical protein